MKKICFLSQGILLLIVSSSFAMDYYVSKSGSNIPACISSPGPGSDACLSIMYVIDNATLSGGDKVYIQAGTYDENIEITSADSGDDINGYVTFASYQNDDVTLTYSTTHDAIIEVYESGSIVQYIKFDGSGTDNGQHIIVDGAAITYRGIKIKRANNIVISHCEIKDCDLLAYSGIKLESETKENAPDDPPPDDGCKDCIIEYCKIHGNGNYGIKISGYGSDRNIVRYNDIYSNGTVGGSRYGMNLSGGGFATNRPDSNEIYNNNFYNNYGGGFSSPEAINTKVYNNKIYNNTEAASAIGIRISTNSDNCEVYSNEIYGNRYYGIEFYGGDNGKIYNNLVYNNGYNGIRVQNGSANNFFFNNTVYENDNDIAIYVGSDAGTGNVFKNNISYVVGTGYAFRANLSTLTVEDNCFYKEGGGNSTYLDGNPRDIAYMNDSWGGTASNNISENTNWDPDFKLTESTQSGRDHVRDGGQDLSAFFYFDKEGTIQTSRPQGEEWDMGAYELAQKPVTPKNLKIVQ